MAEDTQGLTIPLPVILVAVRAHQIIGTDSTFELVPYVIFTGMPELLAEGPQTPVKAMGHFHDVEAGLLRRVSGQPELSAPRPTALLGCGSLGSHIAINLARMGAAPSTAADKELLRPHNAGRHALIPDPDQLMRGWSGSKAKALARSILGFQQQTKPFDVDVVRALMDDKIRDRLFPKGMWAVINATASLAVRETLASMPPSKIPRVIETSLFGDGQLGLMTVEGPDRNPDVGDLIALTYETIRRDAGLGHIVFKDKGGMQRRDIGQGCGSVTMAIPDAQVSLFASSITLAIQALRQSDLPEDGGSISLGRLRDGIGLSWNEQSIPPSVIISSRDTKGWMVRVSAQADAAIQWDVGQHPGVETGGVLMGRISEAAKAFYVTGILPAPDDSERSPQRFVLGKRGLRKAIEGYIEESGGALYCLGTWHSHLQTSGPSALDRETAEIVRQGRLHPSTLVITTPGGYCALVTEDAA